MRVALVALGGSLGAVLRYLLSGYAQQISRNSSFPVGTLIVNILGCLTIGFPSELAENHGFFTAETRAFAFIGVLGGFTTFSAFGNETMNLLHQGEMDVFSLAGSWASARTAASTAARNRGADPPWSAAACRRF